MCERPTIKGSKNKVLPEALGDHSRDFERTWEWGHLDTERATWVIYLVRELKSRMDL